MTNLMPPILAGASLGLAVAAPIGPVALLCITRTLSRGALAGLATGMGAASIHAFYGFVAAMGAAGLTVRIADHGSALHLAGAVMLLWMAMRTARRLVVAEAPSSPASRGLLGLYLSTAAFTLGNPLTLISFTLIVPALLGVTVLDGPPGRQVLASLAAGVFMGSTAWWTALTSFVAVLRRHVTPTCVTVVRIVTALGLVAFALLLLRDVAPQL